MQPQDQNSDKNHTAKIAAALKLLIASYDAGGSLLVCGNGGSAADCEHIVGELMKGFCLPRLLSAHDRDRLTAICGDDAARLGEKLQYGLPALSLVSHSSLITAIANDLDGLNRDTVAGLYDKLLVANAAYSERMEASSRTCA